jgi:hypothetical protein
VKSLKLSEGLKASLAARKGLLSYRTHLTISGAIDEEMTDAVKTFFIHLW